MKLAVQVVCVLLCSGKKKGGQGIKTRRREWLVCVPQREGGREINICQLSITTRSPCTELSLAVGYCRGHCRSQNISQYTILS